MDVYVNVIGDKKIDCFIRELAAQELEFGVLRCERPQGQKIFDVKRNEDNVLHVISFINRVDNVDEPCLFKGILDFKDRDLAVSFADFDVIVKLDEPDVVSLSAVLAVLKLDILKNI